MFHSISWSSYWEAMLILLVVYYVIIFLLYGRCTLFQNLKLKISGGPTSPGNLNLPGQRYEDEIIAFIAQAGQQSKGKDEIIIGLRRLLDSFPNDEFNNNKFSKLISKECEDHCSVYLSEEDLRVLLQ